MLQEQELEMKNYTKQVMLLALGLILSSAFATRAAAGILKGGPLVGNSTYAFNLFGGDSTTVTNPVITTFVGSFSTNSTGKSITGILTLNDNGGVCKDTFTGTLTPSGTSNIGAMTWTVTPTSISCAAFTLLFTYDNAPNANVLYFSSNGNADDTALTLAGFAQFAN